MIMLRYNNLIIHFNPDHPEKFQVEHDTKNTKAYYRQLTFETHGDQHIGVYRIQFPDAWLPEFITITETELDIRINHTPTRDRLF